MHRRPRAGSLRFVNSRLVDHHRASPLDPLRRAGRRRPPLVAANDNHPTVLRRIGRIGTSAAVVCLAGVLALLMTE